VSVEEIQDIHVYRFCSNFLGWLYCEKHNWDLCCGSGSASFWKAESGSDPGSASESKEAVGIQWRREGSKWSRGWAVDQWYQI
jgi:hypothetical protein